MVPSLMMSPKNSTPTLLEPAVKLAIAKVLPEAIVKLPAAFL